jgi:nucleoside triphosphate pyrophosphatase
MSSNPGVRGDDHPLHNCSMTPPGPRLILASSSKARLRVLRDAGFDPEVAVSGADETVGHMTTAEAVIVLAGRKAHAVAPGFPGTLVLACDSMLELDGASLGKPHSESDVVSVWERLAGRQAPLWTGHYLIDMRSGASTCEAVSTLIRFGHPSNEELRAYAATGDALELAGAFSIEGRGGPFVEGIDGSPSNVLGLSLPHFRSMLDEIGVQFFDLWGDR